VFSLNRAVIPQAFRFFRFYIVDDWFASKLAADWLTCKLAVDWSGCKLAHDRSVCKRAAGWLACKFADDWSGVFKYDVGGSTSSRGCKLMEFRNIWFSLGVICISLFLQRLKL